ncbi:MAG: MBOAT family protein [Salibacteraceae bacterium]
MLFNSPEFVLFMSLVFVIYWGGLKNSLRAQNLFILCMSYAFYGWWDPRFLSLIFLSSVSDYCIGYTMNRTQKTSVRKWLLALSIGLNLGLLGFFKYYNFFIQEFVDVLQAIGFQSNLSTLEIILPVGISFYTFQTLSYTIDVYRNKIEPEKNLISFFAFVSFFPQLVAGPIERASNLLPQFAIKRTFDKGRAIAGLRLILWGLVKKVVIADTCAIHVNYIFENHADLDGSVLVLGALYFAFQIYGDFSGYSDIAIGTARLLGFDLMRNFAFPYFSRDIAEFWRRWHISLSTWFRDYLYIPLGGSKVTRTKQVRNVLIIFLVSGFWHGANWTFIIWGLINALMFLPLILFDRNRNNLGIVGIERPIKVLEMVSLAGTFALTCLAWVFFRAESVSHAISYMSGIISSTLFAWPGHPQLTFTPFLLIVLFVVVEWFGRKWENPLEVLKGWPVVLRWTGYYVLSYGVLQFSGSEISFIYFQF